MGLGDYLGWLAVITVFVLFWSIIYILVRRAKPPTTGDEKWLSYALGRIAELDLEIEREKKKNSLKIGLLEKERDDWKRQAREYTRLRQELEEKGIVEVKSALPILVAAIGSDVMLSLDLTALRAVRNQTGLQFIRIEDATLEKITTVLNRQRANRHKAFLHLAVHAGPQGIELGGTVVDAVALSEILDGVQILVIAGCESDQVADLLGVVPFVVSFTEKISNTDARAFCQYFWQNIGNRMQPDQALDDALERLPPAVSEFITRN